MNNSYQGIFGAALVVVVGIFVASAMGSERTQYDDMSPRSASNVLPADLLKGELWTVGDEVIPVEGLFKFQVQSAWGEFPVWGEAMLVPLKRAIPSTYPGTVLSAEPGATMSGLAASPPRLLKLKRVILSMRAL